MPRATSMSMTKNTKKGNKQVVKIALAKNKKGKKTIVVRKKNEIL